MTVSRCSLDIAAMFQLITYVLLSKLLFALWLVVTSPPLLLLVWIRQSFPRFEFAISCVAFPLALYWVFGCWWLGSATAHRMVEGNQSFFTAIKETLLDVRLSLGSVPLIGSWFLPNEEKDRHDEDV